MFLQILPPDNPTLLETVLENQLLLVILGLATGVFAILKVIKYLSKIKITKVSRSTKKPIFS